MAKIRFDVNLNSKELKALDNLLDKSNRSRKNWVESLIILAIKAEQNKSAILNLNELGAINVKYIKE